MRKPGGALRPQRCSVHESEYALCRENPLKAMVEQAIERIRGAWRFRWWGLLTAWGVCLVGWATILCLPDRYEASARVFVDARTALSRATEGLAVTADIDSQIERVRQALLGGPELEDVARKEGLQSALATPTERQNVVSELRQRIQINARGAGLYVISYTDPNRDRSLRVVDRIVNHFVEDTLSGKRQGSEQAERFLREQIAEYERRLSAAEDRLAGFKKRHVGLLPGTQSDYFARLQTEMDALAKARTDLAIAQRQREELQRQERGGSVFGGSDSATVAGTAGAGATVGDNDLAARIRETQARLDELKLRFTDKHPDVIALRSALTELKARQQAEIDAVKRGDAGAAARMGLGSNPVFRSIQLQLNQTDVDIAALKGKIAESQGKIASLNKLVNTAPEVEAEFARLNRDYDVTRTEYQALVQRLQQSRLSAQAEETGIVRFEVIDPPSAAFKPVWPKRPPLIIAVLLAALAAGGGVAYLLHRMRPVFNSARELNEITGLPVLGVVNMTRLEKQRAHARGRVLLYAATASLLMPVAAVVLLTQSQATRLLRHWLG